MRRWFGRVLAGCALFGLLSGCDSLLGDRAKKAGDLGEKRLAAGDCQGAIAAYEDAIDGTPATAEYHYRAGLIYDDKLRQPIDALHHFQRYVALAPQGRYTREVRNLIKDEQERIANAGDKVPTLSQAEAVRLKNENLKLNEDLERLRAEAKATPTPTLKDGKPSPVAIPKGARTYVVKKGDTLAAISRRFYKNSSHAKALQETNHLADPTQLQPGQTLIIP